MKTLITFLLVCALVSCTRYVSVHTIVDDIQSTPAPDTDLLYLPEGATYNDLAAGYLLLSQKVAQCDKAWGVNKEKLDAYKMIKRFGL